MTQATSLKERHDMRNAEIDQLNKIVEGATAESGTDTQTMEDGAGQSAHLSLESSDQEQGGSGSLNHDDKGTSATATIASLEAATNNIAADGDDYPIHKNLQLDLTASPPSPSAPITTQLSNASSNECSSPVAATPIAATPGRDQSASLLLPGYHLVHVSPNLMNQPPSPHHLDPEDSSTPHQVSSHDHAQPGVHVLVGPNNNPQINPDPHMVIGNINDRKNRENEESFQHVLNEIGERTN